MPHETTLFDPREPLREISSHACDDEVAHTQLLLQNCQEYRKHSNAIAAKAQAYIKHLRNTPEGTSPLEAFLQQYHLNSEEGLAIMCLAEALLRIPDAATADAMIYDTLPATEWEKHMGKSRSTLVNASTWGLVLSGKLLTPGKSGKTGAILHQLVSRMGEPVIRVALKQAMRMMGGQFIMGETIKEAMRHAKSAEKHGYLLSYDMLGEGARSDAQAAEYFKRYMLAIETLAQQLDPNLPLYQRPGISVKLSALDPRYQLVQEDSVLQRLLPRLKEIVAYAMQKHIMVTIDAEEANRLDISLLLFHELLADPTFQGFDGIGLAIQAYQKRSWYVLDYLQDLAERYKHRIPVRLVKGAYWDTEIKLAQVLGLSGYPVFTRKEHTDVSYIACAEKLLTHPECFYPQFATHNAHTIAAIQAITGEKTYEFQRLHGMGKALYDHIHHTDTKHPCRIYAPVGQYHELLPYLIRRLLENGANTSFVHQLASTESNDNALWNDPVALCEESRGRLHPDIPLPEAIYQDADGRKNSLGFDLGYMAQLAMIERQVDLWQGAQWQAFPIIDGKDRKGDTIVHCRPSAYATLTGQVTHATEPMVQEAMAIAQAAFPSWSHTPAEERAKLLETFAHLLEVNRDEALALCIYEAGKTLPDAIAEVREAVDFCRYYAAQTRQYFSRETELPGPTGEYNSLSLHGRGVFVCISPWNFPLAIFTGQVTAALAAGNCVIAKPSDQTPLIGHFAVKLMLDAGFPSGVIQLLPGSGKTIGNALIAHPAVAGVAFTGSTATAQHINRTIAAKDGPIIPLIAETGGQNTMIVDSTALHEVTMDDILLSAFGSAGQRCSALRVLYVQEEIADHIIPLLRQAMQELRIGLPEYTQTDIGPVIDRPSQEKLLQHIKRMQKEGTFIGAAPLDDFTKQKGYFVPPHAFEIPSIRMLQGEVFGPILHVIRFHASALDEVIHDINSTGFGLTFGIQSRIDERIQYLRQHIHAGNIYVNRSMIGATVGVQPFGGEGLSGTGFKAGGPHYLLRFATERAFCHNIAAIGGNINLLAS